jgi:hypothetical protein
MTRRWGEAIIRNKSLRMIDCQSMKEIDHDFVLDRTYIM